MARSFSLGRSRTPGTPPSLILNNFHYSGSSALVPVLAELLPEAGYHVVPLDPARGPSRLEGWPADRWPFFYWGHDAPDVYGDLIGDPRFRFVYVDRDPRDVVVSWAADQLAKGIAVGAIGRVIQGLVELPDQLPQHLAVPLRWRLFARRIRMLTFEQVTRNTRWCVETILSDLGVALPPDRIAAALDRWSFERVTGRRRGEDGPQVRSEYMFRKGTSGQWREAFDERLLAGFRARYARALVLLGWESGSDWGVARAGHGAPLAASRRS